MRQGRSSALAVGLVLAVSSTSGAQELVEMGMLPGDRVPGPCVNAQMDVAASAGLGATLVVWTDSLPRSSGSQSVQADGDIVGIRVDGSGAPLDPAPFIVAGGMGLQQQPRVAFNGQDWLVVYKSQDPVGQYFETRPRAVRVSASGQVLDATPISFPLSQFTPDTVGMTVAGQDGQWLVTRCIYHADGYGTFAAGQRVSGTGQLLDPTPRVLMDWTYGSLTLVASGGEFLLAGPDWTNGSLIKAQRVSAAGLPVGGTFNLPSGWLSLAAGPSGYYAAWSPPTSSALRGSPMSAAGVLADPAGELISSGFGATAVSSAFDGTNWWIAWSVASSARAARIAGAGNVLDPGGVALPIPADGSNAALYTAPITPIAGGGVLLHWQDSRASLGNDANVFALPIGGMNVAGVERCISTAGPSQRNSDVAITLDGRAAVAFVSERAGEDRVLLHLLAASGSPQFAEPIEVAAASAVGRVGVAFNGSSLLVAWDQSQAQGLSPTVIRARRVGLDGSFIDAQPFDVMPGFNAAAGALGGDFLVAGARFGAYPQNIFLHGARIDGQSAALMDGPSGVLLGGFYVSGAPRVRSDGARWLVTAHSQWTHDSPQGDAILAYVPPSGPPTAAFNPTPFSGSSGDLDVAFGAGRSLLVWRSNSLPNANNLISGRIMNGDGTFAGGAFTIAEAAGRQLRPAVVWDGSNFLVAWDDQRRQATFFDARTDIFAARVSESGVVLDPAGFLLVDREGVECSPALAAGPGGVLISSTRFAAADGLHGYRIGVSRLRTGCAADFNTSGSVTVQDVFDFLAGYFSNSLTADVNDSGDVTVQDVFDFLTSYFSGCP